MRKMLFLIFIGVWIDQVLKILVENFLSLHQNIIICKGFFSLSYVRNYGAAFSLLDGNRFLFILIAFLALIVFYFTFFRNKDLHKWESVIYSLFISGILGNLIDRIFRGYVVDYLSFSFGSYFFPVFNFADICIVVATFGMIIFSVKEN